MLISTSRKPSQKTRKFCKNLARCTGSVSVNRGKMNMRELLLKALEIEEFNLAIVNEIKGNPSRISFRTLSLSTSDTIFNCEGAILIFPLPLLAPISMVSNNSPLFE